MFKRIRWANLIFWALAISWVIGFWFILSSIPPSNHEPRQDIKCGKAGDGYPQGHYWKCFWERTTDDPVAFFTLALVFLGSGQAALFLWQLRLIRKGLADTKEAADAAKESAETGRQALIASQRAWIRIDDFSLGDDVLDFNSDGASVTISFQITNVGNLPALNVMALPKIIFVAEGLNPFEEHRKLSETFRKIPVFGFTLFPNQQFSTKIRVTATFAEIEKGLAFMQGTGVFIYIVGFIAYTFPTDSDRLHQTGFNFELRKKDNSPIVPSMGSIAIEMLRLRPSPMGKGYYVD